MGQVIFDSFSGVAGTTLVGRTPDFQDTPGSVWAVPVGAWKVDGTSHATMTGSSGSTQLASIGAGAAPQRIQADLTLPATSQIAAGIFLRYTDANNYWALTIKNDTGGASSYRIDLIKRLGGVETPTTLENALTLGSTTQTLAVSMDLVNNVFTCSRNGSPSGSPVTDGTAFNSTSATCGILGFFNGIYQNLTFTNFSVQLNPAIIPTTLPNPIVNVGYSQTLSALGANGATTFAITTGALPSGLTLSSGGVISGTPTATGSFSFTVQVTDAFGDTGTATFIIGIAGKPVLVTPDPRQTPRTRRFQQGVAAILNSLGLSGFIQMTPGGGFQMAPLAIGDTVTGGHWNGAPKGGDVLYVGQGPVLAQDDNFSFLPTASVGGPALLVGSGAGGQVFADGVSAINLAASDSVTVGNFISLQSAFGEAGFFQAFVDSGPGTAAAMVLWAADFGTPNYPAHVFAVFTQGAFTPLAPLGTMATAGSILGNTTAGCTYHLLGLSGTGGTPYAYSIDASGNFTCAGTSTIGGATTITSTSANALTVGRQGATSPVLEIDASTATVVTGLKIKGAASGSGVALTAISSATNEALSLDGKGTGQLSLAANTVSNVTVAAGGGNTTIGSSASAAITLTGQTTINIASSTAFQVGRQGTTSPAFQVNTSSGTSVTGVKITAAAAGSSVAIVCTSTNTNEGLSFDAKGTGTLLLGTKTTQPVTVGAATAVVTIPGTVRMDTIQPNTASTTSILGTGTNDNASAGNIGEFKSSAVASGSAVALTTATPANITNLSLSAGDWDVEGNVNFGTTAATFSGLTAGLSSTSATLPTDGTECYSGLQGTLLSDNDTITLPRKRFSLASTTTVYLVGQASFSAGSVGAFGAITARRVR